MLFQRVSRESTIRSSDGDSNSGMRGDRDHVLSSPHIVFLTRKLKLPRLLGTLWFVCKPFPPWQMSLGRREWVSTGEQLVSKGRLYKNPITWYHYGWRWCFDGERIKFCFLALKTQEKEWMDDAKVEKQNNFGNGGGGERNNRKKSFSFCKLSGVSWEDPES